MRPLSLLLVLFGLLALAPMSPARAQCPPPPVPLHTAEAVPPRLTPNAQAGLSHVAEKASAGGYRAVTFGESNMVGWPEPMLSQALDRPTLNAAAGGGTQTLLWQFQTADFSRLRPELVVLMLGGNNLGFTACEVYWGIRADVQAVRQHFPQARVIVMGMMPGGDHFAGREDKKLAVNAELRASAGRDYDYLDIYGPIQSVCDHHESCPLFHPDNIHYTRDGYVLLSGVLHDFIARAAPR